ncbi:hypothetical protein LINGRAHAP2_LOCUS7444 [Linum grandiflorum]
MENNGHAVVPPNPQPQQPNPQGEPDPLPVNLAQQHAVIGGDAPGAAAANDAVNAAGDADELVALAFGAKRPLKSDVSPHFTRFLDENGVMKAKCKYCHKIIGGDTSNGTFHLMNHKKVCVHKQIHDGSQKNLVVNFLPNGGVGKKELCPGQFNNEVSRKQLATMVVMH